ncbi:MAG: biopolymer transporter ExbD [Planctomycetota bacterium]
MKLVRSRERARHELPLIGMIDAFFLLLIYFLVSSTITPREEELLAALSARTQDAGATNLEPQIVEVLRAEDGRERFSISGQMIDDQAMLTRLLGALPKEPGVFVLGEDSASVGGVASALQAAEDAGFTKVTYVTPE